MIRNKEFPDRTMEHRRGKEEGMKSLKHLGNGLNNATIWGLRSPGTFKILFPSG